MKRISTNEFQALSAGSRVLERGAFGDKVLLTPDSHIIKIFYRKRLVSSDLLFPYAKRFCTNAQKLHRLGVPTVSCRNVYKDKKLDRHYVRYRLLPGQPLRTLLDNGERTNDLLEKMARFLAQLHDKGVYFRSVHLANVLVLENGDFGLIDIADMSIKPRPLNLWFRARNFRHLLHKDVDQAMLGEFGTNRFRECYETEAHFSALKLRLFHLIIRRSCPTFAL